MFLPSKRLLSHGGRFGFFFFAREGEGGVRRWEGGGGGIGFLLKVPEGGGGGSPGQEGAEGLGGYLRRIGFFLGGLPF